MVRAVRRWSVWLLASSVALAAVVGAACEEEEEAPEETPSPGASPQATTPPGAAGTVDVVGIWGAEELTSFEAMVAPWEQETGGNMEFTGTRDITALLTTRVEGGNPPDVAVPAEIGLFQRFAREGQIVPLSECEGLEEYVRDNYPQAFIDLGTVDGVLYGFFMKADTKATIWYDPSFFEANGYTPLTADASFDDLIALSDQILSDKEAGKHGAAPWSMGQFANGGTGFPGSDTIQQILLNEAGAEVYDGVIDGSVPFTDPAMKSAWEKFGQIALTEGYTVQGGAEGINATNFQDATFPPFEDPPTAAMTHLGGFADGFIKEQFPDAVPGEDYAFFPWPGGAVTGGANIAYAFNSDPTTCSFLMHIASAEAQQIWVERGGFTSVNEQVSLDAYPDEVARAKAQQLLEAEVFRFDLDDAIGGAVQQAFFQGVTEYLANPGSLDTILANIEAARQ
ncbi:MAG TPA: ABC transporter substrate-binding protein [Dehalococcoidia bacterium]|nr:ABC transporter substrate-binding protein [Dehalococcoidia bacterium]